MALQMQWMRYIQQESVIEPLVLKGASLEQILDHDDVLQDFRMQHQAIIDYFTRPDILISLLHFLVDDHPETESEKIRFRYPFLASEILAEDNQQIRQALMSPECHELLFSFIEKTTYIMPVYAHHVCRIFHSLLCVFGKELVTLIDERNSIPAIISHLECFPFCELLYDIIVIIETNHDKAGLVAWMKKYDLVYRLLSTMRNPTNPLVPSNTGQILNNIIGRFAATNRDELFNDIFGDRESALLVEMATDSRRVYTFTSAVSLFIDLVWNTRAVVNEEAPVPVEEELAPPPFIAENVLNNVQRFANCLKHDWTDASLMAPREGEKADAGPGAPPQISYPPPTFKGKSVGNYRIKVVILISTLVRSGYGASIDNALINSDVFDVFCDLFFDHPENTILHSELYTLLEQCMLIRGAELKRHVAVSSPLYSRVYAVLQDEATRLQQRDEILRKREESGAPRPGAAFPDPARSPCPAPKERVKAAACHLAHVLHLARVLEEHRYEIDGLDEALAKLPEWDNLYERLVIPQMKRQETELIDPNSAIATLTPGAEGIYPVDADAQMHAEMDAAEAHAINRPEEAGGGARRRGASEDDAMVWEGAMMDAGEGREAGQTNLDLTQHINTHHAMDGADGADMDDNDEDHGFGSTAEAVGGDKHHTPVRPATLDTAHAVKAGTKPGLHSPDRDLQAMTFLDIGAGSHTVDGSAPPAGGDSSLVVDEMDKKSA